jgi:hypothetical protein
MVEGGLAGIAAGMAFSAWWSVRRAWRGSISARIGAIAVLGSVAVAAFAGTLLLSGIVAALVIPGLATLAGLTIALFGIDDDDSPRDTDDDDPPWWPTFERQLRSYERQRVRS